VRPGHLALLFRDRVAKYDDRVALRHKRGGDWLGISWREVGERADVVARALVDLGLPEQSNVAICSPNRPEWTLADLGILTARLVSVPIYPTSSPAQMAYILQETSAAVLFAGGAGELEKALAAAPLCPALKKIVVLDPEVRAEGDRVCGFEALLEQGRRSTCAPEVEARLSRAAAEDLLTIIYTSGTTGEPKGVMLTHANLLAAFAAHDGRLKNPNEGDLSLCFLPLSHVFERCWTYYALNVGMTNHYLEDPTQIAQALQEVRPTILCCVPRLFEKVYAGLQGLLQEAPPLKRKLFHWSVGVGREAAVFRRRGEPLPAGLSLKHRVADALVLKKIRGIFGGRVKFLPCAGAPLAPELEEFFDAAGLFIAHGYGLTETSATVSCHEVRGYRPGTVGKPLPGVEVKISHEGEILVRAGTVTKGYYKKPEATEEAFVDGWFRTGDIGSLDPDGCLRITDRLKDLIKTAAGKYVAPQQLEMAVAGDPFVEHVFVLGDRRRFVTALIVPNFEVLEKFAQASGIGAESREALCAHPGVLALYRERVDARTKDLARHEQIKRFALLPRPFTIEEGDLTPTLKVMRRRVAEKHATLIESLYAE
jgi:long-chain acyl-CoA synthetase